MDTPHMGQPGAGEASKNLGVTEKFDRRAWHRKAAKPVNIWLIALIIAALIHPVLPNSRWVMVHLFTLGALTNSIFVWSQFFSERFLGQQPPNAARPWQLRRIALLNVGIVVVVAGQLAQLWQITVTGAALVGIAGAWHGVSLYRQYSAHRAGRPFATSVFGYCLAFSFMLVGVVYGMFNAAGQEHIHAHMIAMVLGFAGITALSTLEILFPAIWRTQRQGSLTWSLGIVTVGLIVAITGTHLGATLGEKGRLVVGAGLILYAAGWAYSLVRWGKLVVGVLADPRDRITFASLSVAAAPVWMLVGLVELALGRTPTIPLVVGFAAQLLLGAMSFILPTTIGGGPAAVRAGLYTLNAGGIFRATMVNAGLIVWLSSDNSWLKVLMSALCCLSLAWFIPALVRAVKAQRAVITKVKQGPEPRTAPAWGQATAALAFVALAGVLMGSGGGMSVPQSTATATGTTAVTITAKDMSFEPKQISVPAGHQLTITLVNADDMMHDLKLANGAESGRLNPGQSVTFDAGVITANLDGWCTIAGHKQQGMTLAITTGQAATHSEHMAQTSETQTQSADLSTLYTDPVLQPASEATHHELNWNIIEIPATETSDSRWLFVDAEDPNPQQRTMGPTLRGHVGDTFTVHLTNKGTMSHSLDFHAGMVSPDPVMKQLAPGESVDYTFTAVHAGAWLYHCGTAPMSMHMAAGMYGAVVIDPPNLASVDAEYVLVQAEHYAGHDATGEPTAVTFNGTTAYVDRPLTLHPGQTARFWLVNAGPNVSESFHIVGTQFHTVYKEGAYLLSDTSQGAAQALDLSPAQGGFVEAIFPEVGTYTFVNHQFIDAERGAKGKIVVQ